MLIGLPQALHCFEYEILWRSFFEELGAAVVSSGPTTRSTLRLASRRATTDLCFPVKVWVGHLLELADRVDLIFVPSLRRPVPSAAHCAKIVGLPDLARSVLPATTEVLEIDIDLDQGRLALAQAVWRAGRPLTWNPVQITRAAEAAWIRYTEAQQAGYRAASRQKEASGTPGTACGVGGQAEPMALAVVGHPYLLWDRYVNYNLLGRLADLGVAVFTPDMLPEGAADAAVLRFYGEVYWAYAPSLLGAGLCFLESGHIDGLLAVIAFGCAPDSGLAPVLAEVARRLSVPMLTLVLDQHSGEAGLATRIEAFADLLERKKRQR